MKMQELKQYESALDDREFFSEFVAGALLLMVFAYIWFA